VIRPRRVDHDHFPVGRPGVRFPREETGAVAVTIGRKMIDFLFLSVPRLRVIEPGAGGAGRQGADPGVAYRALDLRIGF
jgi:hypothetical protein